MVRPTDNGSSTCAPTNVATHARLPPLTVIEIPTDAMTTTVTAMITEAAHTSLRKVTRAIMDKATNYGSSSNVGSHAPLLGQDARNAGTMRQSLTVYQPNNGTSPAPVSAAGTPGIRYGATYNAINYLNSRQPGTFRTGSG